MTFDVVLIWNLTMNDSQLTHDSTEDLFSDDENDFFSSTPPVLSCLDDEAASLGAKNSAGISPEKSSDQSLFSEDEDGSDDCDDDDQFADTDADADSAAIESDNLDSVSRGITAILSPANPGNSSEAASSDAKIHEKQKPESKSKKARSKRKVGYRYVKAK